MDFRKLKNSIIIFSEGRRQRISLLPSFVSAVLFPQYFVAVSLLLHMLYQEFIVPKNNVIRVASMGNFFIFLVLSRPFILCENNPFYFPFVDDYIKVWNRRKP